MNKVGLKKITSIILKILSFLSLIVLFVIAVFFVFFIIVNQVARMNNTRPLISIFTIVSPSMEPNIMVYDVIVDLKVDKETDLKKGDIITFYSNNINTGGYTITHRIYDITEVDGETRYVTKGDNNPNIDDGYITFKDIVGKVRITIPDLGKLQFFMSSRIGWLIVILIPALGIIIIDIVKLLKIFKIKKEIEDIPEYKRIEDIREIEENKKMRALIERADKLNRKK